MIPATATFLLPETNGADSVWGPTYVNPTIVKLTYSGNGDLKARQPTTNPQYTTFPAQGFFDPAYVCQKATWLSTTMYGSIGGIACNGTAPDYLGVYGTVKAVNGAYAPATWDILGGGIFITLERVVMTATITANHKAVTPNTIVTFTTTLGPDSVTDHGTKIALPTSLAYWFIPDTGGRVNGACSWNVHTCDYTPPASGTMWYGGTLNGEPDSVGAHVDVVPCLTGDSVLDSRDIRDSLLALLQRSENPNPLLRREHGGFIYELPTGAFTFRPDTGLASSDCYFRPSSPPSVPGASSVAQVHTHPHESPDTAQGCLKEDGTPYNRWVNVDPKLNGGGSNPDWDATQDGFDHYVISSPGDVYLLQAGSDGLSSSDKAANPHHWAWNSSGSCHW